MSENKMLPWLGSGESPFSGLETATFSLCPQMAFFVSDVSSYGDADPMMKASI